MKLATKTFICGLTAFALYACSNDNASAPEQALSQASGNNEEQQQARIDSSKHAQQNDYGRPLVCRKPRTSG